MINKLYQTWAINEHRKMWKWIARETVIRKEKVMKRDYVKTLPYWKRKIIAQYDNCFVCASVKKECKDCPLIWLDDNTNKKERCRNKDSFYCKWFKEEDWVKAGLYAKMISNLPEKNFNI